MINFLCSYSFHFVSVILPTSLHLSQLTFFSNAVAWVLIPEFWFEKVESRRNNIIDYTKYNFYSSYVVHFLYIANLLSLLVLFFLVSVEFSYSIEFEEIYFQAVLFPDISSKHPASFKEFPRASHLCFPHNSALLMIMQLTNIVGWNFWCISLYDECIVY